MIDDSELRDLDAFGLFDAEAQRMDGFLSGLSGVDWLVPTRCEGWRRREMLSHLAASEDYNQATLDGTLPALFAKAKEAGVEGMDDFNAWGVRRLADMPVGEVLGLWRSANAKTRQGMRERGWDGSLSTSVGPYPAGLQALHLAVELAIHADDMDVRQADAERRRRTQWVARFARFTVREYDKAVTVEPDGAGGNRVSAGGLEYAVDDAGLVEACSARLPADHPMPMELRELLRVFA